MIKKKIILIRGDGIGLEISKAVEEVNMALGSPVEWIEHQAGMRSFEQKGVALPQETINAIGIHKIALKGPLTTPVGSGFSSVNVKLRQHFNLFANIRPVFSLLGITTPYSNVDLVIFRENTEDIYIGIEKWENEEKTKAQSLAIFTETASENISKAAFEYATVHKRKKVTLVHKANILKKTHGLFLGIARKIAAQYPHIQFDDQIVDAAAMNIILKPGNFDIILTTNLFGDILSDLAAGLVGGLGLVGGANIGHDIAIFEAVHGSASDIKGRDIANPIAFLFSFAMLLEYIEQYRLSNKLKRAIENVVMYRHDVCTPDIRGGGTTKSLTGAICQYLKLNVKHIDKR